MALILGCTALPKVAPMVPKGEEKRFCWILGFEDNFRDKIRPDQLDFMDITILQGDRKIKTASWDPFGQLRFSMTKGQISRGPVCFKGRCWRKLSSSRVQIWEFEEKSIAIDRHFKTVHIHLLNVNTI